MKKFASLLVLGFGVAYVVAAQNRDTAIASINKMRQEIKNNIPNFRIVKSIEDSTSRRNIYSNAEKELQLISIYIKRDGMDKYVVWYFSNNHLIYSEQVWTDSRTGELVDNEKLYMSNDHLIYYVSNGQPMDSASKDYKRIEYNLVVNVEVPELASFNKLISTNK